MKKLIMLILMAIMLSLSGRSQSLTSLNEGFENGIPDDWTVIDSYGWEEWTASDYYPRTGNYSAFLEYQEDGEDWLITPLVMPTANNHVLSFWLYNEYSDYADYTIFTIEVSTTGTSTSDFTVVHTVTYPDFDYEQVTVDLSDYIDQPIYIAFHVIDEDGTNTYIDDVSGVDIYMPDCYAPISYAMTEVTGNTATISWGGPEDAVYHYQVKLANASWDESNILEESETTDNYVMLENLNSATNYTIRVKSECADETTEYSSFSFRTTCGGGITLTDDVQWTEYFEDAASLTCWTLSSTPANKNWTINNGELYHNWNDGTTADAVTPVFDISSLSTPYVKFSYRIPSYSGGAHNTLTVLYRADVEDEWTVLKIYDEEVPNMVKDSIPLPDASETYQLNFRWSNSNYNANGIRIDSLVVYNEENPPLCFAPMNLVVSDITGEGATLTWTQLDDVSSWNVYVKKSSASSYGEPYETSEPSYELTDLEPSASYDVYVTSYCESEQASSVVTFLTPCMGLSSVPVYWDFESPNNTGGTSSYPLPNCWNRVGGSYPTVSSNYYHGGSSSLYFYNTGTNYAVLPILNLDELNLSELQLSFYARSSSSTPNSVITVGVMTNPADASTFVPVSTFNATYSFSFYEIPFSSYDGDGAYIAIRNASTDYYGTYIDDMTLEMIPTCSRPGALAAQPSSNSATLTWTSTGSEFVVYYKKSTESEYTEVSDSFDGYNDVYTYELQNLEPTTTYQWYVSVLCDGAADPLLSGVSTFSTPCEGLQNIPITWNFDSQNTAGTSSYPLPNCWTRVSSGTSNIYPYAYSYSARSHSGSYVLYFYNNYSNCFGVLPYINTDEISISDLQISLYASVSSTSSNTRLEIGVMTDPSDTTTFTLVQQLTGLTTTPTMYEIPLSSYDGDGAYIAIRNVATGYASNYFYIDDVTLEEIPSCSRPTALEASPSDGVVTLTWTSTGSDFTVYYKKSSDSEYTPLVDSFDGEDDVYTYELLGLTASTNYQWYVSVLCDGNETPIESTVSSFRTPCAKVVVTDESSWTEDFSSTDALSCWTLSSTPTGNNWSISSSSLYHGWNSGTTADAVTPIFDISEVSTPYLKFAYQQPTYNNNGPFNKLNVLYRTEAGGEWILLKSYGELVPSYIYDSIELPSPSENYQLNFRWTDPNSNANGINVDNITIYNEENPPLCSAPISLTVENITDNSATLSWTQPDDVGIWNVYIKKANETSYGDPIETSDTYVEFTDLDAITSYNVYVEAICEENQSSSVSTFRTACGIVNVTDESPWSEYFNDNSVLNCWTFVSTPSNNNWSINSGSLYHDWNSGTTADAISPILNIEELTTPYLKFSFKLESYSGGAHNDMTVLYRETVDDDWITLKTYTDEVSAFKKDSLPLPNASSTYQINFRWSNPQGNANGARVDSITVYNEENPPACLAPIGVTVSNLVGSSATVSWTQVDDIDLWNVYYKKTSETSYGEPVEVSGESTVELNDLESSTSYNLYVVAMCETEETSTVITFQTPCGTVSTFPYIEDFESGMLGCWTTTATNYSDPWTLYDDFMSVSNYLAYAPYNDGNVTRLISPIFDISGLSNPYLYYLFATSEDSNLNSDTDSLAVYYRTSENDTWIRLTSHRDPSFDGDTWYDYHDYLEMSVFDSSIVALPEASETYQLMFIAYGNDGYGVYLDNIKIFDNDGEEPVEPIEPTVETSAATNVTETTATLHGTITLGNQTITARGFEWKESTAANYTSVSATGTNMTYNLSNLTPNTTYTYHAFVTTANGTQTGDEVEFTTLEQSVEPCTPTTETITATVCYGESYEYNGVSYSTSGTHTLATLTNAAGCDSTVILNLTVRPQNASTQEVEISSNELPYQFGSQSLTAAGTYTEVFEDANGCDSTVTLT
ncbi:MAG: choice-of-anchor J domain-containing protein, partial [Bacteroidales bacterium]|nr:choice-of-anchor J domain-containing protein [Bacteroidales bacterium]